MRNVVENAIENDNFRTTLVWSLLGVCMLSAILYAYWLNATLFEAIETRTIKTHINDISSALNGLQERYLSMQNKITLSKAQELGLSQTDVQKYVSRKALGKALSVRDEI